MSGNASNGPMLKAAGLWAKSSVKGGQYLTGRLGGVKVLILENRDRQSDGLRARHMGVARTDRPVKRNVLADAVSLAPVTAYRIFGQEHDTT
jgi:hypothetical protein